MALVTERVWRSGPRKVKRCAWGYTVQLDGKQVREFHEEWSKQDAERALAARQLGVVSEKSNTPALAGMTFGQAVERYLAAKTNEGKKRVDDDRRVLGRLLRWFGGATPLAALTAGRIAEYREARAGQASQRRLGERVSPASVNADLAPLRHLLRLAHGEWEVLAAAPRIRLLRKPQGRLRWLEPAEEERLLAACLTHGGELLRDMVLIAIETGLRQGEILGMTWERLDLSRGVIRLEFTKSGRRREVPMRQALYERLSALPGARSGRLWPRRFPRTAWDLALAELKLEDFTFHDLRHHFASWFIMREGSLPALREILGHTDIRMTLRYAHLAPHHLRMEIDKTAAQFNAPSTHGATIGAGSLVSP
jgi:integrase